MLNSRFPFLSHYMRWLRLLVIIAMLVKTQHSSECCLAAEEVKQTSESIPKLIIKPGQAVTGGMQTEDIVVTDDVELAKEQVAAYPESPEASFILAVALTRTSMVEQALKEVRRARRLADKQGGPAYFDHMISTYEDMLKLYPKENKVRYGLAWAYYMKAYVLTNYAKKQNSATPFAPTASAKSDAQPIQPQPDSVEISSQPSQPWQKQWVPSLDNPMKGQSILENVSPSAKPQIKVYYESALKNLDDLLALSPNDIWARVYRAFVYAEYTGDLNQSMAVWRQCQEKSPDNPAPYFFLGEGYLKQGNLQLCLENVSKAIALRSIGK